jgi:hypothetical protein
MCLTFSAISKCRWRNNFKTNDRQEVSEGVLGAVMGLELSQDWVQRPAIWEYRNEPLDSMESGTLYEGSTYLIFRTDFLSV